MAVASMAGAAAGGIVNKSADPRRQKLMEAICGALVGIMVGPAIADLTIGLANEGDHIRGNLRMAIGFAVAAVGAGILTMFIDVAKSGSIRAWMERFVPPKPPIP